MTEVIQLRWIKTNLGPIINSSLAAWKQKTAIQVPYTEDWLAGIAMREVGQLVGRAIEKNLSFGTACETMRGDYSQRPGDAMKVYHGFGFWQVDVGSYSDFVRTGQWKDPSLSCRQAITILYGKQTYLSHHCPAVTGEALHRALTAAYNNGEGNQVKVIIAGKDVDAKTTDHNYSAEVWRFRDMYRNL
jgi:hypothetical protein